MPMRIFTLLVLSHVLSLTSSGQANYPVPPKDDKLLFYFQRSCNTNTIIYELNKLPDGRINPDRPINLFWISYEKGGYREDVSFIQRRGFGLSSELIDKQKESFVLHFYSYKKRTLYLLKVENQYKVFMNINGEMAELNKLFIKCENNALGFPIIIDYVAITGKSVKNGIQVIEKIKP